MMCSLHNPHISTPAPPRCAASRLHLTVQECTQHPVHHHVLSNSCGRPKSCSKAPSGSKSQPESAEMPDIAELAK